MSPRIAAADLGKRTAKLLVGVIGESGLVVESSTVVDHGGRPLDAFARWYDEAAVSGCAALGVTGLYADEIAAPALAPLPEDACLAAALDVLPELRGPRNLVSVGARGYAVLVRDGSGRVHYVENDKCSSGTGETMVKTAARFGMTIEQADRIASAASLSIAITARCSVFAKSEMTHFGNQGEPADRLFRGYFDSIARYVAAMLARVRVPGPVHLIGGASRLQTLRACLEAHIGSDVSVIDRGPSLEAIGALVLASEHAASARPTPLPRETSALVRAKRRRIRVLPPASDAAHRVTRLAAPPVADGAAREPCILGLDLGSTGSKAVLTSIETGEIALDLYDRTRGNPVEASQRLVRSLLGQTSVDVRAIAVTGSGREAVATVLRAAYPDAGDRIIVANEIVAHATAAIRCDDRGGESVTVVEIGGQDAKFIRIAGGQIVESDMNKACSAGTGSFLEEQAALYGVEDIHEFARLASAGKHPPDLGQMCTVFVADAAAEANAQGFTIPDLFAGFQYSVIHNYLNRVMGQRAFSERVFFQGKPASGESLAWTLAAVSGREVIVPPNPGAMGAWGIGLCACSDLGAETLLRAPLLDLQALLDAKVVSKTEFRCEDKRCATLCRIERATVSVGGVNQAVFSGGSCPKFEVARAGRPKLPADAPSAFDEREALLAPFFAEDEGGARADSTGPLPAFERVGECVCVPYVGPLAGWLPWTVTLLRELGLRVRVLRPSSSSLARGEELCPAYDACAPTKVAYGVARDAENIVFLPRLLDVADRDGGPGKTCASEQAMPVVVSRTLADRGSDARVVMPVLSFEHGLESPAVYLAAADAARELGVPLDRVPHAVRRAAEAQRHYERELSGIGWRTLAYGRARQIPVVVVCGSLHVVFDPTINAGIPAVLRQNGALALPMDCYRVPSNIDPLDRVAWGDARRALRVALGARAAGDVYPLWLSAFGCGPSSFVEQIFDHLMRGYPHTCLESDGHGGAAGFVTRVQSFLHGVRAHDRRPSPAPEQRLAALLPVEPRPLADGRSRVVLFSVADRLGKLAAAAHRSLGYDAVASGPNTSETLALGRRDCSGKECLPYQLVWGSFRRHVEEAPTGERSVLLQVMGQGACRNCMFSVKDRISLERLDLDRRVDIRHFGQDRNSRVGFLSSFLSATLGWEVLEQLGSYHRAAARDPVRVDQVLDRYQDELLAMVERPQRAGLAGVVGAGRRFRQLLDLVERASRQVADLERGDDTGARTVLLTGDIYVRIDEFANDGLVRALNRRGVRVLMDPVSVVVEYLSLHGSSELLGLSDAPVESMITHAVIRRARRHVYGRARARNRWLPMADVAEMLERARPLIDGHPFGEAPITVGSALSAWAARACDGVVVASPWGCGPALVAESLLRSQRDIPMLFVYSDGSPLDERRVDGFAHRLRRQPSRVAHGEASS